MAVIAVLTLTGCGRKESGSMQADLENLMTDAVETFGETKKSEAADNYEGMEDSADGTDYGAEGDIAGWRGDIYKFELEGENEAALNGKSLPFFWRMVHLCMQLRRTAVCLCCAPLSISARKIQK